MIIRAKFDGRCRTCKTAIQAGDSVDYTPNIKGVRCMACVSETMGSANYNNPTVNTPAGPPSPPPPTGTFGSFKTEQEADDYLRANAAAQIAAAQARQRQQRLEDEDKKRKARAFAATQAQLDAKRKALEDALRGMQNPSGGYSSPKPPQAPPGWWNGAPPPSRTPPLRPTPSPFGPRYSYYEDDEPPAPPPQPWAPPAPPKEEPKPHGLTELTLAALLALEAVVVEFATKGLSKELEGAFEKYQKIKALALNAGTPAEERAALKQALIAAVKLLPF